MFGKYKHTLDPKGRLFVPAKLREELGSAFYVARSLDPCLTVYTEEEWQRIVERSKAAPSSKARGPIEGVKQSRMNAFNSSTPASIRSSRQVHSHRRHGCLRT